MCMKKFLSLLMMSLLCVGAWAAEVTFGPDFSLSNWTTVEQDQIYSWTKDGVTITFNRAGQSQDPETRSFNNGYLFMGKGNPYLEVTAEGNITAVNIRLINHYQLSNIVVNDEPFTLLENANGVQTGEWTCETGISNLEITALNVENIETLIFTVEDTSTSNEFTATTVEGVEMKFTIISETDKTCCVGTDLLALIDPSQEASADNLSCIAIDPYYEGKVTIPSIANGYTVTTIGEGAFQFCEAVTAFEIPTTITSIHKQAFAYCSAVTSLEIPDEVQELGDACFYWCESAKTIKLPAGLTSIPQMMATSCHALENIELPTGIESIPKSAFAYCTSLPHIDVPEGVTRIDESGFLHCEALQSITLPTTLKRISNGAFTSCEKLEAIEVPEGIEYLGDYVFWNCHELTTFTFPATLTHIGTFLFASDENLTSIYSYLPEPIELGDWGNTATFSMLPGAPTGACTLYVPAGTVEAYRAASGWNVFLNIEEMNLSGVVEVQSAPSTADAQHYNLLGQPVTPNTPGIHVVAGKKIIVR